MVGYVEHIPDWITRLDRPNTQTRCGHHQLFLFYKDHHKPSSYLFSSKALSPLRAGLFVEGLKWATTHHTVIPRKLPRIDDDDLFCLILSPDGLIGGGQID